MKLFDRIANWLIERAKRTPYFHLEGYMNRWWLLPYAKWRPAARVHEILRSDDDRAFHDHPWPYITVILKGGYWEVTPIFKDGIYQGPMRKWHGPGSVLFRRATSWHRLELPHYWVAPEYGNHLQPRFLSATTLFITFGYQQRWGFMPEPHLVKVDYRDYLGGQPNARDSSSVFEGSGS